MLEINKRYMRTSPKGDQSVAIINTEEEIQYHKNLMAEGFTYKEIIPTVARGSVCISCEG